MYRPPNAPQRIGGVLDSGFGLFGASLKDTFVLAFVAQLLSAPFSRMAQSAAADPPGFGRAAVLVVAVLIMVVVSIVLYGAILARIHARSVGTAMPLAEALGVGWRRGPAFFGAGFLYGLATFVGLILLIVPGVYLMVSLVFCYVAAVVERKGPIESLQYSRELVRGHWWRTAGLLTVIGIVVGVLYVLLGVVIGITAAVNGADPEAIPWYVDFILTPLISGVLGPLGYSLYVAAYNDLKLRREGTDIAERIAAAEA